MYAPYGPYFAIIPDIVPRSASGESMAMINSMGALGSFVGTYFVGYLTSVTGAPNDGFLFMALCLIGAAVLTMLVHTRPAGDVRMSPDAGHQPGDATLG